jgi:hypothetical protein
MFEIVPGFPEDVLAVRGRGRVSAEDYRDTLIPEALRRIKQHRSLRLLCILEGTRLCQPPVGPLPRRSPTHRYQPRYRQREG